MFLATGDAQYQAKLFEWFPDPTALTTFRWGWVKMYAYYGNAIRDYAFATRNGRLQAGQIQQDYLNKCISAITNCAEDTLGWSRDNAYGSSFPDLTKAYHGGGWYFSAVQAFDLIVAYQFNANPDYLDAFLRNLNYEGGCNPVNVTFVTGLGWKRQHTIVDQYSANDRHALPKDGIPISNLIQQFYGTWIYGSQLGLLTYPSDYTDTNTYSYYDRWCDDWNVSTEGSTTDTARSFAGVAWLAAQTSLAGQAWRCTNAVIITPANHRLPGQPVTVTIQVADTNLGAARIVWEAQNQEPVFGSQSYTFTPGPADGDYWIEAEVQWPDGRRAFATNLVTVNANAPAELSGPRISAGGGFSFLLAGTPQATYVLQASTNLMIWDPITTNVLPANGVSPITDPNAPAFSQRYYRAAKGP